MCTLPVLRSHGSAGANQDLSNLLREVLKHLVAALDGVAGASSSTGGGGILSGMVSKLSGSGSRTGELLLSKQQWCVRPYSCRMQLCHACTICLAVDTVVMTSTTMMIMVIAGYVGGRRSTLDAHEVRLPVPALAQFTGLAVWIISDNRRPPTLSRTQPSQCCVMWCDGAGLGGDQSADELQPGGTTAGPIVQAVRRNGHRARQSERVHDRWGARTRACLWLCHMPRTEANTNAPVARAYRRATPRIAVGSARSARLTMPASCTTRTRRHAIASKAVHKRRVGDIQTRRCRPGVPDVVLSCGQPRTMRRAMREGDFVNYLIWENR
jgi:hypothetical protein